jgi:hypothetical protein
MGDDVFDPADDHAGKLEVEDLESFYLVTEAAEDFGQHPGIIRRNVQVIAQPAQ